MIAEAAFDLAALVAADKAGKQTLQLPLSKVKGHVTISFSCCKLAGLIAGEAREQLKQEQLLLPHQR